jgi:TPP-dependent pyruvate/acetoin dehydrogenase alpha subunit
MDESVRAEVDDAAAFAEASPEPSPDTLYDHVYADTGVHGRLFFDAHGRSPAAAG